MKDLLPRFLQLFCPTPCLGCERPCGPLCEFCRQKLRSSPGLEPATPRRPLVLFLGLYQDWLRQLVHHAKFGRSEYAARTMAEFFAARIVQNRELLGNPQAVLSPPVSPDREWFHPGRCLAREISRRLGLPLLDGLLRRVEDQGPTHHQLAEDRPAHLQRTLLGGGPAPAGIRRVLFVDDLITTGSTARRVESLVRFRGMRITAWIALARPIRRHRISRNPGGDLSQGEENSSSLSNLDRSSSPSDARPSLDDLATSW